MTTAVTSMSSATLTDVELSDEIVVISLCYFRKAQIKKKDKIQSAVDFADNLLKSVYKEHGCKEQTFENWKELMPVLIADTLYHHNDLVFWKNQRKVIIKGGTTRAKVDGGLLAEALKCCGVLHVYNWADHLRWELYDVLRKSINGHLESTPEAKKAMEERAEGLFHARKKKKLEDIEPGPFWYNCAKKRLGKTTVDTREAREEIRHNLCEFIKEEAVSVRFGFEWCTKSALIWHPILDASKNSFATDYAEVLQHLRDTPYSSWPPHCNIRDVVIMQDAGAAPTTEPALPKGKQNRFSDRDPQIDGLSGLLDRCSHTVGAASAGSSSAEGVIYSLQIK